jgi:alpha-D-ribose 1-methylphosphonate 5-triphosphate synthase subunit PhnG
MDHDASQDTNIPERRRWMGLLAQARPEDLQARWDSLAGRPSYDVLRPPESGLVMTRGRMGGTGDPFNLGEMTVTRCSVRTETGFLGHAYIAGRNKNHAELAAVCDALLQDPDTSDAVAASVIEPLAEIAEESRREQQAKAASTKVEFFTLVRGED